MLSLYLGGLVWRTIFFLGTNQRVLDHMIIFIFLIKIKVVLHNTTRPSSCYIYVISNDRVESQLSIAMFYYSVSSKLKPISNSIGTLAKPPQPSSCNLRVPNYPATDGKASFDIQNTEMKLAESFTWLKKPTQSSSLKTQSRVVFSRS